MYILFLAIQDYLISKGLPSTGYIRMWNNNLEYLEKGTDEQYQLPAIFIEFPDEIEYDQLGNGTQTVDDLRIKIHILQDFYDTKTGAMSQNLDVLVLAQSIYTAFQEWMPTTVTIPPTGIYAPYAGTYQVPVGVMSRRKEYQDKDHDNIYHFIQEYSTTWIDTAMNRPVGGVLSVPILLYELDNILAWDNTLLYTVDQYVSYSGFIYQCILNTTVAHEVPTNTTYWKQIQAI